MKYMHLLMLLCVCLVKVESTETAETAGIDEQPAESPVDERYGVACTTRDHCQDAGGICKRTCSEANEEEIANGCHGTGCICCAPKKKTSCRRNEECREASGKCQSSACSTTTQREIHNGCRGSKCHCCAPKVSSTSCVAKRECTEDRGKCSSTRCKSHEREIRNGCKGSGCFCCTSFIRDTGDAAVIQTNEATANENTVVRGNEENVEAIAEEEEEEEEAEEEEQ